jgi:hypothetical protein
MEQGTDTRALSAKRMPIGVLPDVGCLGVTGIIGQGSHMGILHKSHEDHLHLRKLGPGVKAPLWYRAIPAGNGGQAWWPDLHSYESGSERFRLLLSIVCEFRSWPATRAHFKSPGSAFTLHTSTCTYFTLSRARTFRCGVPALQVSGGMISMPSFMRSPSPQLHCLFRFSASIGPMAGAHGP